MRSNSTVVPEQNMDKTRMEKDGDTGGDNEEKENGNITKKTRKPRAPKIDPQIAYVLREIQHLLHTNPIAGQYQTDYDNMQDFIQYYYTVPSFDKDQLVTQAKEFFTDIETESNDTIKINLIKNAEQALDRALELEPMDTKVWKFLLALIDKNIDTRKKTARISLLYTFMKKYKPTENNEFKLIFHEALNLSQLHVMDGNFEGAVDILYQVLTTIDKDHEGYLQVLGQWLQLQVTNKNLTYKPLNQTVDAEQLPLEILTYYIIYQLPVADEEELSKLVNIFHTKYTPNHVILCIHLIQELILRAKNNLACHLLPFCKMEESCEYPEEVIRFHADMYLKLHKFSEACSLYSKLLKNYPNNEDIIVKLIIYSIDEDLLQNLLTKKISPVILINSYFSILNKKTRILVCDKLLSDQTKHGYNEELQKIVLDAVLISFQEENIKKGYEIAKQALNYKQLVQHRLQNSYLVFLSSLHIRTDIWTHFLDFNSYSKCNSLFSLRLFGIVRKLLVNTSDLKKLVRWEAYQYSPTRNENSILNNFINAKISLECKIKDREMLCNRAIDLLKPYGNYHYNERFMAGATFCLLGFERNTTFSYEITEEKADRLRGWLYTYKQICNAPQWLSYTYAEQMHQSIMSSEEARKNASPLSAHLKEIEDLLKLKKYRQAEKKIKDIIYL